MTFTWGEIQLTSIQKMFLNNDIINISDLDDMKTNNKYKTYFNAMPQAANEGILRLLSRTRPLLKMYELTQYEVPNMLSNTMKEFHHLSQDIVFETDKGLSYYFEVDNMATVNIYVNDILVNTIDNETRTPGIFTAYKGFLDNTDQHSVKIQFTGNHPYNIRYIAIYPLDYQYTEDDISSIPDYGSVNKYNLKQLIPDFYKIDSVYYEHGTSETTNITNYVLQGDNTVMISQPGNYKIYYKSYPSKITSETSNDHVIEMEPETLCLLPLYIVSELYKDDDVTLSTVYRNQFETGLENLYQSNDKPTYVSKSGWL